MRLPRQKEGRFGSPTLAPVPPRAGEDVDDAVLLEEAVVVEAAAALPRAVKVEHVAKVEVERQEPSQDRLGTECVQKDLYEVG